MKVRLQQIRRSSTTTASSWDVGALLYAANTSTRPDIAYATSMLCRAMSKPTDLLMAAAFRVLAYLSRHKQVGLRYTPHAPNHSKASLTQTGL